MALAASMTACGIPGDGIPNYYTSQNVVQYIQDISILELYYIDQGLTNAAVTLPLDASDPLPFICCMLKWS